MKLTTILIAVSFLLLSCKLEEDTTEPQVNYSTLKIQPEIDTVFLNANGESRQFSMIGSVVNVSEKTISNSGLMTDAQFTVRQIDTSFQSVDVAKAQWLSTNTSVVTVSNGLVTAKSAGSAEISAMIGSTTSQAISINVRPVNVAPGLSLNPPLAMVTFQNFVDVSGIVQQQAKLTISESNSGLNANVNYNSNGSFSYTVSNLNPGIRTITVRATHPSDATLFTERTKTILYYQLDSITGNWLGTTLGKNFNFNISRNSIIPTRYDINGKIDIQFEGIGLVRDINIIGIINPDGTINASLSQSYQGFSISGKFNGYFKGTGIGEGEYSAKAEKSGWPKISFNEKWTAVKIP